MELSENRENGEYDYVGAQRPREVKVWMRLTLVVVGLLCVLLLVITRLFTTTKYQCCGFQNGTSDWGDIIPKSCQCPELLENTTECIGLNVKTISGEIQVYRQPCFPYLFHISIMVFKVRTAFAFICLLCLIVGPILSSVILCQMRRRTITPPVTFTAHSSRAKYTELG